ncbi:MAG: chromate transporter [Humidesulfovibrio sp.]|uniref:chromate transporter n=1 Tax=Humidesulfovibrio sp. TaxID=2910988 RepID=UPI002733DDD8|nr:chromate transporter [Humidesulfovibrio sp.]MDP2847698.1 chromate transporter [Humidesulfovibrio sp.]
MCARPRWRGGAGSRRGTSVWVCPSARPSPEPRSMQLAAFTGLSLSGIPGAIAAYLGFALPAFCLVTGLSAAYFQLRHAVFAV